MAVRHDEYKANFYAWSVVRDSVAGESQVKRKNTIYLPMPSGMEFSRKGDSIIKNTTGNSYLGNRLGGEETYNPNLYPNPAYQAYLQRAHFPGITSHTLRGLLGIATRKPPSIALPKSMEYLIDDCSYQGWSLITMFRELMSETLQTGRVGSYLEVDKNNKFKLLKYKAEDILNWQEDRRLEGVLLREYFSDEMFGEIDDIKELTYICKYDEDNDEVIIQSFIDDEFQDEVRPSYLGKAFTELPIKIIGAVNNEADVDPAPLYPVAATAMQIYMKNADLSQAEYLTCNPTLILTGISPDESPMTLGSTVALCMSDPASRATYTQTDSNGMTHLLAHIKQLSNDAGEYGASLIASNRGDRESSSALKIRQSASTATLHSVVNAVGDAITALLKQAARLMGEDPDEVIFIPNVEFADHHLDPLQLKAVVEAYLNKTISLDTLVDNFRRSGVLQTGDTVADELNRLEDDESLDLGDISVDGVVTDNKFTEAQSQESTDRVKSQDIPHTYSGKD